MVIKVTPAELKNQSNQVLTDIKAIEKHWKNIESLVKGTKNYWEGDASNTHIRIYRDVKDDVDKILKRLKENPVKLQQMAGVYEETEGMAENTANELPTDLF
ncbi:MAG: WXG100 family type VII secretion target [Mogibacterium sp.]|nr:WXG100 family type VII secretion target [Mogibacterium sp.]